MPEKPSGSGFKNVPTLLSGGAFGLAAALPGALSSLDTTIPTPLHRSAGTAIELNRLLAAEAISEDEVTNCARVILRDTLSTIPCPRNFLGVGAPCFCLCRGAEWADCLCFA
jgi:hypothetical protein